MLAFCYEQQERLPEALRLAERGVQQHPDALLSLQTAVRLSVALQQHEKAAAYVRRALALPEVRNEIPGDSATPPGALLAIRLLSKMPLLRRRIRPEDVQEFEPGAKAMELQGWKRWAEDYLAWYGGSDTRSSGNVVH